MTARMLKYIAVVTMMIDHVGLVLIAIYSYRVAGADFGFYMTDAYWYLRVIGRIAFPIFAFLIAEGCSHTKDIKKYILRLGLFALISQPVYQAFNAVRGDNCAALLCFSAKGRGLAR